MITLTRSSERISNPMSYTGIVILQQTNRKIIQKSIISLCYTPIRPMFSFASNPKLIFFTYPRSHKIASICMSIVYFNFVCVGY